MAEQEELTLRVSLDDQASVQLAALRGQLDQMRGGSAAAPIVAAIFPVVQQLTAMVEQLTQLPAQITAAMSSAVQGLGQVQTQLTQVSTQIQQATQAVAAVPGHVVQGTQALGAAVRKASFEGSFAGGFLGDLAGGAIRELKDQLLSLGNNLIMRSTDFHGLAESMKDVEIHARGVGMSMTGYEGLQRQMQIGGMSAKEAQGGISRLADMQTEFQQYGVQFAPSTRKLTQNVRDPETLKYMYEYMEKMSRSTVPEKINLINEAMENIRKTMTARNLAGSVEGAQKEFLEAQGLDPASWAKMQEGYRIREDFEKKFNTPARAQMLRDRTEETKRFNAQSLQASFYWEDIGKSLAGSLLHGLEITGATKQMNTWLERALVDAEEFEKVFRETDFKTALEALEKLDPAIAPYVEQVKQLAQGLKATADTTIAEFQAILPIIHEINDLLGKLGLGPPKPLAEPGTPERAQQDRDEAQASGALGAGYVRRFLLRHGLKPNLTPGGEYVEPEPESPETSKLSPLLRLLDYNRRQREAEQKELERQQSLQPAQPAQPVQPELPPSPPPSQQPPEMSDAERAARERMKGLRVPGRQSYEAGAGQPIIVSPADMAALVKSGQSEAGGDGLSEGYQLAGYKGSLVAKSIEEAAGQFKTPGGLVRQGVDIAGTAKAGLKPEAPTLMGAALSTLPFGLGEIPGLLKQHEGAGDSALQWIRSKLGIPDADVPDPSPWAKGGAWHKDEGQPSSFENRFGVWPGMGADKLDQTSAKLDQAANQNVNISGAGKIQVDVRAPPGTSVDATGEGFFKSTEITRLTQMMPADMGPLPMTGVSTGQGIAGNGTMGTA